MEISEKLFIDCPPTMAFDLMADVRNLTRWNEGASRADKLSDGPIATGTVFVTVNRGQEMKSTITTFSPPERLDFDVRSDRLDVASTFTFTPSGTGTELVIEFEPKTKGIMKLLFPVLRPIIKRDLAAQHLRFKSFCEAQHRSSTRS